MPKKEREPKQKEALEHQIENLKAQLVRALADYDNLQKRVEKDYLEIGTRIKSQFLTELLPAIQMLYGVQNHLGDPGLALSISQFEDVIHEQGVEKIEPKIGDKFNEDLFEAVDAVEDAGKAGTVAELVQIGWRFHEGRVISHAKVKVFK